MREAVGRLPTIETPSRDFAVGSEIDGLYGFIDTGENRAYLLVTGNLETNFNKLVLFLDVNGPGEGQNTLRTDNVDIDFNALGNMGGDGIDHDRRRGTGFVSILPVHQGVHDAVAGAVITFDVVNGVLPAIQGSC